jgi:hypothetical protein
MIPAPYKPVKMARCSPTTTRRAKGPKKKSAKADKMSSADKNSKTPKKKAAKKATKL